MWLFFRSLKSQWIGKITTQQTKISKVNTVSCILVNILASIYRFESFTWIPIQILYIHGHFKLRNIKLHMLMINSHTELELPVVIQAPSIRIRIFFNPLFFLSGFGFRPHVSGESCIRIRNFLNPLSIMEFLNTLWILNRVDAKSEYAKDVLSLLSIAFMRCVTFSNAFHVFGLFLNN